MIEPVLGRLEVAPQERHPRLVLPHPRPAATIAQFLGQPLGLTEQPFGIAQRPAEHLDEAAFAQRGGQLDVVAEFAEQLDARAEFDARRVEVAGALLERADEPASAALVTSILGDQRRRERGLGVDPGRRAASRRSV